MVKCTFIVNCIEELLLQNKIEMKIVSRFPTSPVHFSSLMPQNPLFNIMCSLFLPHSLKWVSLFAFLFYFTFVPFLSHSLSFTPWSLPLCSIPFPFSLNPWLPLTTTQHQEEHRRRRNRSPVKVQVQRFDICSFVLLLLLFLVDNVVLLLGFWEIVVEICSWLMMVCY